MVAPEITPAIDSNSSLPHIQIALAIRSLRHRSGLSQRQLAGRMQVPRTYVSKIENEKALASQRVRGDQVPVLVIGERNASVQHRIG